MGLLAAGCSSDKVSITDSGANPAVQRACRSLVAALPNSVSGQPRRQVDPPGALGAAWGNPPITLRCGVPEPASFSPTSQCQVADGVDWYVDPSAFEDQSADVVLTTVYRSPTIEVTVPARDRPPVATLVDLAPALKTHTHPHGPGCL